MPSPNKRRVVFPEKEIINLGKFEICNICEICNSWFVCFHRDVKWCSLRCYRRTEKQIVAARRKNKMTTPNTKLSRARYRLSAEGRKAWHRGMSKFNLQSAIEKLQGSRFKNYQSIQDLYNRLVDIVSKNKKEAEKMIKGGTPDAEQSFVEFKFGRDTLRPNQIILDILKGRNGKVRWLPSWDSLELTLEKKKRDESILFDSYLSYLKWCNTSY